MVLFVLFFSPDEKCAMVREAQNKQNSDWCFPISLVDSTSCLRCINMSIVLMGLLLQEAGGRARLPSALLLLSCPQGWGPSRAETAGILLGNGQW